MKRIRDGEAPVDLIGANILHIIRILAFKKSADDKISSTEVVEELSKRYPREEDYVPKDVRDVADALGLPKFPLKVSYIHEEYHKWRKRRQSSVKIDWSKEASVKCEKIFGRLKPSTLVSSSEVIEKEGQNTALFPRT